MPIKRYKAEQIVTILRQIEVGLANGKLTPQACKEAEITVQTYYRWRKEYGGLKLDQAKRLKELEKENAKAFGSGSFGFTYDALSKGATYGDAIALGQARQAIKGKPEAAREIREAIEGKTAPRDDNEDNQIKTIIIDSRNRPDWSAMRAQHKAASIPGLPAPQPQSSTREGKPSNDELADPDPPDRPHSD